jgi:NHLM bacteriocin system ABC transporter peptidase/ATP-binding protein
MSIPKVPAIIQMEAVECGAASLAMILAYYGRIVPLEEMRVECGVSRDGSKASNVLRAARKYGLEAKGFRMEPEDLKDINMPAILFWNFNHFIVLKGFKGNKVYINDPATGPKVITYEEFDQCFTGVVLTFKPTEKFQKGGEKPNIITPLKKRLKGSELALVYIVLAGLFLVIPGLVVPTFSKIFVDNILVGQMKGWIKPLIIAMLLTMIVKGLLTWLQQYYLLRFETKLALESSAKFFLHVLKLPVEFFFQRQIGEISNRVQINDKVANLLAQDISVNVLNFIMIVFYAILMFQYDVLLTIAGISIAFLNLLILKFISNKRVTLNQRLLQERGKLMGTAMSGLQLIESLKSTGSEADFYASWSGYQAKVLNAQQEIGVSNQILSTIPPFLATLNNILILTLGGIRVMDGHLSMGMLIAFQGLMGSFITPVNDLMNLGGKLQETFGDLNRLDDVLKYKKDDTFNEKLKLEDSIDKKTKLDGYLELKNVTFGYNKLEPPLIEGFNLKLNPGERVALVGGSGSGKSTVAKMVAGLYAPWEGEILYDGKKLSEYPREMINNSIAMVDQDIFLFEGTVTENITMWDRTIDSEKVIEAAKDACIHEIITERAGGYDGRVDEGGANFSGGQRQRIEIARALVVNPSILILDEATSALDPNTEKIIDDNIRKRGCACLIIAHRLSTIRDADEIIVLEKGKIVQRGTHDELMKDKEGLYYKLVNV